MMMMGDDEQKDGGEKSSSPTTTDRQGLVVGIVSPGLIGCSLISILSKQPQVSEIVVALDGRSDRARERFESVQAQIAEAGSDTVVRDVGKYELLCAQAAIIFSAVPSDAALDTAKEIFAAGFKGTFCDVNRIPTATARAIGRMAYESGATFADAGLLGTPGSAPMPLASAGTMPLLALSGVDTEPVLSLLEGTEQLRVKNIGRSIGQASALALCNATFVSGMSALLMQVAAVASAEQVDSLLAQEWQEQGTRFVELAGHVVHDGPERWGSEAVELHMGKKLFEFHDVNASMIEGAQATFQGLHDALPLSHARKGAVELSHVTTELLGLDGFQSLTTATSSSSPSSSDKMGDSTTIEGDCTKPKVLCLHGWRTSARIMKYQFRDMPKSLNYMFVDAAQPARGPAHAVIEAYFEPPFFEWWDKDSDDHYTGIDQTLQQIRDINKEHGPFDGIAGFSQGAGLSLLLALMKEKDGEAAPLPDIKFALLCSPFIVKDPTFSSYYDSKLQMPAFVMYGETDYIRDWCETALGVIENKTVSVHSGGHEVSTMWNGKETVSLCKKFCSELTM